MSCSVLSLLRDGEYTLSHIRENRKKPVANSLAVDNKKVRLHAEQGSKLATAAFAGCLIRCECGMEILLVPDFEAMSRAIENHVAEHKRKEKDPAKAAAEAERVRDTLIAQALEKAGRC